jgi:hypothetical protein
MKQFFKFIEKSTENFKNKIVEAIEDDNFWLNELGISDIEISECKNIRELILSKLEDKNNTNNTYKIIEYVLNDFVLGDDDYCFFYMYCSANAHTGCCALYVFKFNDKYNCYYYNYAGEWNREITNNPIPFCNSAFSKTKEIYEIEKKVINDEYWEKNEFNLQFNIFVQIPSN